ncbi:hypothetical protein B0I37DRAFT_365570 [Chaetomium sp. MPI-CAGE-AT-0009]|nr:hypothetical protein B0I37DRAFT_365570 [Chaetomium sp. MPI-CAGE-AT-0009]
MLESLLAERNPPEERQRPIVFICHSLGGLVFKQAYLLASENSHYPELKKNMKGVMFFGTPHRGSSLASWATVAARLLAMSTLGTRTNTRLPKDLEPSSEKLRSISDMFHYHALKDKLRIVSFYETDKLGLTGTLVVDRASAVLGLPEIEIVIPLEGDHRSICRFSSANLARFRPVEARIRELTDAALQHRDTTPAGLSLITSLKTTDYIAHRARNPMAMEGTCEWVLKHPKFETWLHSTETPMLWISGDPGCGKSVLASFLVDRFSKMSQTANFNICYFFCKSDNLEQSGGLNAVQALIHLLLVQRRGLATSAAFYLEDHSLEDIQRLWDTFVLVAQRDITRTTICILDGVDECDTKSRGRLLSSISRDIRTEGQVGSAAPSDSADTSQAARLKFIVTSRPENQIKVAFERMPRLSSPSRGSSAGITGLTAVLRLRGEDETDAISQDVATVVKFKIDDLIANGLPAAIMEAVQRTLIARADRTFLWVSLILNLLEEKVEAGASRRELDEVLKTRDIFDIYTQLLESRSKSPRARKMLGIILAATRPLTLDEISVALVVPPTHETLLYRSGSAARLEPKVLSLRDMEYDMVFPAENHIKSLCGHFVRIIQGRVYLVHETAREFLLALPSEAQNDVREVGDITTRLGSEEQPKLNLQHSFYLIEAEALLLEICVAYLYCLAQNKKDANQTTTLTRPFLGYAAWAWMVNFC